MEKSFAQLHHIERISRQTRHHRTHLNHLEDQKLYAELNELANEREQSLARSLARRRLEQERKQLLNVTVKQIARERQQHSIPRQTVQETVQVLSKHDELRSSANNRPSSSVKLPSAGTSCRLFSHACQLYPCQPIYQYTSFTNKEYDQTIRKRNSSSQTPDLTSTSSNLHGLLTTIQEKKHQQGRRQLSMAIQNQNHLVHRYASMQRTMARLDEQSRALHQRLADKKSFGYAKERQQDLTQAIERHLQITAKFCA